MEDERVHIFKACKIDLEKLNRVENETAAIDVEEIQDKIDILMDMKDLIVIYDPIEDTIDLEDAIADAMLKSVYHRRKDHHRSCAEELKWCLVGLPSLVVIEISLVKCSDLEQSCSRKATCSHRS